MEHAPTPNLDALTDAVKDMLTVRRVFGDPIESGDALVIPVAKIAGGSGVGYGDGEFDTDGGTSTKPRAGDGGGAGFGARAKPAGVFRVRNGEVHWHPAVDINRLALGGQIMVAVVAIAWAVASRRG
jgi:uncharacterized spore protein YtfJ